MQDDLILTLNADIPLTKTLIKEYGFSLASHLVDDGHNSALDTMIKLRALRDAINHAILKIEEEAMEEAGMYGRDDSIRFGVKFQTREGRINYIYENDSTWATLKENEMTIAQQRKKREKFLQSLEQELVDPDTGEIISPPEIKSVGKFALALTFPR